MSIHASIPPVSSIIRREIHALKDQLTPTIEYPEMFHDQRSGRTDPEDGIRTAIGHKGIRNVHQRPLAKSRDLNIIPTDATVVVSHGQLIRDAGQYGCCGRRTITTTQILRGRPSVLTDRTICDGRRQHHLSRRQQLQIRPQVHDRIRMYHHIDRICLRYATVGPCYHFVTTGSVHRRIHNARILHSTGISIGTRPLISYIRRQRNSIELQSGALTNRTIAARIRRCRHIGIHQIEGTRYHIRSTAIQDHPDIAIDTPH